MNKCLLGLVLAIVVTSCGGTVAQQYRMAADNHQTVSYMVDATDQFCNMNGTLIGGPLQGWKMERSEDTDSRVRIRFAPGDESNEEISFAFTSVGIADLAAHSAIETKDGLFECMQEQIVDSRIVQENDDEVICELMLKSKNADTFIYSVHRFIHRNGVMMHFDYLCRCEDFSNIDKEKWIEVIKEVKILPPPKVIIIG